MTDKGFLEKVNRRIDENKTEMLASLSELLSIPSVAVETDGPMPFGEGVDKVYRRMLEMGRAAGFDTFDADGYGGHIDYDGTEDGVIGVIGHLDVVPEGDGWDFDPYGGQVADGYVQGRGASDDKGPVVASFYAMKALKECGFEPAKTIRLVLGLDELVVLFREVVDLTSQVRVLLGEGPRVPQPGRAVGQPVADIVYAR